MTESTIIHKENPLGTEPVGKLLLAFSVPSIIACLVNSVYNIVDQIFIGQGVGYLGNAATTVSFPMMTIVMAFATLAGSGGGAYAAIKLGEKDVREADLTLNNLFSMSLIIGILISALGLLFLDPLLRMFGATETVMPYARDYTSIILMGVPFSVLGNHNVQYGKDGWEPQAFHVWYPDWRNPQHNLGSALYLCFPLGGKRGGHCHNNLPDPVCRYSLPLFLETGQYAVSV